MIYYEIDARLLHVVAASGLAGIAAWPIASNIPKIVPQKLKALLGKGDQP
jgi:hypothetical protein